MEDLIRAVPLDKRFAARLPKEIRAEFKKMVDAVRAGRRIAFEGRIAALRSWEWGILEPCCVFCRSMNHDHFKCHAYPDARARTRQEIWSGKMD